VTSAKPPASPEQPAVDKKAERERRMKEVEAKMLAEGLVVL
jgi:hypothetical protein